MRVAIIGSGPAGFYAAGALLAARDQDVEVDLYERLPTPWGLVRGGVAPDHPKIKSVSRIFEKIAHMPGFRFFGNVEVGREIQHEDLLEWYDAVVYAVGTAGDRRSGIPGEGLPGSWSATEFVGWYNGHPDYRDLQFDLSSERAIVIGNGNVAIDVARMLTLTPEELIVTDAADHAIEVLSRSGVREIVVLGRRGAQQAAFTHPELLELGELRDADVVVDPADLELHPDLEDEGIDATAKRNVELLHEYAARPPHGKRRRVLLRFLTAPVALLGDSLVEAVRVSRNELYRDDDGIVRARPSGFEEVLETGLVFRAIGYTGLPLEGLPFDRRRGVIPNEVGRVTGIPRTYVTGWIKRGPSGVIGTNKKCATETVNTLLADLESGLLRPAEAIPPEVLADEVARRQPEVVSYLHWQAIDEIERAAGKPLGRPRVKLTRVDEMVQAAGISRMGR